MPTGVTITIINPIMLSAGQTVAWMKLLIAWADIHVVLCIVMEFLLAKESLSHCRATLRTSDVSFNTRTFTSGDIFALVVAAVSDYFDVLGFQYFFGGRCRCC
jgi:archaellum biogenesis protein FlaJ (TadC family)